MQTTTVCTRATTLLTSTLLLACALHAGATDTTITITNTGSAVASWYTAEMGYANYGLTESKWAQSGGIALGGPLLQNNSRPTYHFYLPPPQISAGTRELTGLTVKIYGDGRNGSSPSITIGGTTVNDLSTQEGWNTYAFSGANSRSLLTYLGQNQPYRLAITIDHSTYLTYYDLKEIQVQYTYSGTPQAWLQSYHQALGAAQGLTTFRSTVQWGIGSVYNLSRDNFNKVVMSTLSGLLSEVLWGVIPLADPWKDLARAPFDHSSLWEEVGLPISGPIDWYVFWITVPNISGFDTELGAAINSLSTLSTAWQTAIAHGGNLTPSDENIINEAVDNAETKVNALRTGLNGVAQDLKLYRLSSSDPDIVARAKIALSSLSPLMRFDVNTAAELTSISYLPFLAAALENARSQTATLTVASSTPNSGVAVAVAPADVNGLRDGVTAFSRTYNKNTLVTLSAPAAAGVNPFTKWQRDGADWSPSQTTTITMDRGHTLTAVYADPGAPTITITTPTSAPTFPTGSSEVYLHGNASANTVGVTWTNHTTGYGGHAPGTTAWNTSAIYLNSGPNTITVIANDSQGRSGTDSITVTFDDSAVDATFQCTANAFIVSGNQDENYVPGSQLALGYDSDSAYRKERVIVRFNISTIPPGSTINSGTLQMYCYDSNPTSAAEMTVTVYRLINDWSEEAVNWNAIHGWNNLNSSATTIQNTTDKYYAWSVGPILSAWYSGANPNYGFILVSDAENAGMTNERGLKERTGLHKPLLQVNYTTEHVPPAVTITSPTSQPSYTASSSSVILAGTASDNYSVASVTWTNAASSQSGSASGTTTWSATLPLVSGLNQITITATDPAGNQGTDAIDVTYTPPDTTPPSVPVNVVAALASQNETLLTWSPSQDPGGTGVQGYRIYRDGASIGTTAYLQFSDPDLQGSTTYCYAVSAYDYATPPNESAQSTQTCLTLPPPPSDITKGLLAYFLLDGDATDATGNGNNGAPLNFAPTSDRHSVAAGALSFNGTNSYIDILSLNTNPIITLCAWVRPETGSGDAMAIIAGDNGRFDRALNLMQDGSIQVHTGNNATNITTTTIPFGSWNHLTLVYSTTDILLYVNGALVWKNGAQATGWDEGNWRIGLNLFDGGVWPFKGAIDDVRIYNRALSAAEILQVYVFGEGLVAYYPLDGDATDATGNGNNGAPLNCAPTSDRHSVTARALSFNGTNSCIDILSLNTNPIITLCAWVRPETGSNEDAMSVISGDNGHFDRALNIKNDGSIQVHIGNDGTNITTIPIQFDSWSHLTLVYSATDILLYVNGALAWQNGQPAVGYEEGNWRIGRTLFGSGTWAFKGAIDDVRIYSRALTGAEVGVLAGVSYAYLPLSVQRSGTNLIMTWPSGNLLSADTLAGPWSLVTEATTPWTNTPSATKKFYRLRQ